MTTRGLKDLLQFTAGEYAVKDREARIVSDDTAVYAARTHARFIDSEARISELINHRKILKDAARFGNWLLYISRFHLEAPM